MSYAAPGAAEVFPIGPTAAPKSASTSDAPHTRPDILERPRDKTRNAEVSLSALQYLFSEMVTYSQSRVAGIGDLERILAQMGYRVGQRAVVLLTHRLETASNPKNPRRETRLLPVLLWIHSTFWRAVFGSQADSLERSTESGRGDECESLLTRHDFYEHAVVLPRHLGAERDAPAKRGGILCGHSGSCA